MDVDVQKARKVAPVPTLLSATDRSPDSSDWSIVSDREVAGMTAGWLPGHGVVEWSAVMGEQQTLVEVPMEGREAASAEAPFPAASERLRRAKEQRT